MGYYANVVLEVKMSGKWEYSKWSYIEVRADKEECERLFELKIYKVDSFLAMAVICDRLTNFKEGLPNDSERLNQSIFNGFDRMSEPMTNKKEIESLGFFSCYLTLKEVLEFDYDKAFSNEKDVKSAYISDGSVTGSSGTCLKQEAVSYRSRLGSDFFKELDKLKKLGESENVRFVIHFED